MRASVNDPLSFASIYYSATGHQSRVHIIVILVHAICMHVHSDCMLILLFSKLQDTADAKDEDQDSALFKSPADIFRHFCKAEVSDESSSEVDSEASKKKTAPPPSSIAEKGVKWSPNLVEFSDGSKLSQTAASREAERKSDRSTRGGRGRGRGSGGGKRGNGGQPKEPTKPPMVCVEESMSVAKASTNVNLY